MFSRLSIALYSVTAYLAGLIALLYAIGFIGDFIVPKTINSGAPASLGTTLTYDLSLLALFAIQHSVMARQGFKRWWTRFVPKPAERATYVLFSAGALFLLYGLWHPLPAIVWQTSSAGSIAVLTGLYFAGWAIVFLSSFLINHFELFGLQQSFAHLRGQEAEPPHFRTPLLYRVIRHPIYFGLLLAFWCTPHMTQGHLLFALACTGYLFIGITLEERDLIAHFGETYRAYRRAVPMVVPLPRFSARSRKSRTAS